jgi:bacteriorhodopsin
MATPGSESVFLWIGAAGMLLGMLYFLVTGWGEDDPKMQEFYIITIFVPAIAFVSYLSMALGYGVIDIADAVSHADKIYWARYADWLFTTPLLLVDLALLAGAGRNTIATLVGLDVAMIITGLVAAMNGERAAGLSVDAVRVIWWGVSTGFFLVLLYFLLGTLSDVAGGAPQEVGALFSTLRNLIVVLWTAYPVVWIIGSEGLGYIGLYPETAAFMVLDLAAKVGFGIVLLRSRQTLQRAVGSRGAGAA